LLVEGGAQLLGRAVQARLHGAHGDVLGLGDLVQREVGEEPERDALAELVRQRLRDKYKAI